MKIAYLDCFSGISGDMCLGALVNAGTDPAWLEKELLKLPLSGWKMHANTICNRGISGTRLEIKVREEKQPHRSFLDIKELILTAPLPSQVQETALRIFHKLAEAEGKVHGVPAAEIHFHEVGAVDSIVDIVGTALALNYLNIEQIVCSAIPPGSGQIQCRHGILPVPAPATAELLKGIPLRSLPVIGELTTPTGAALAATLAQSFGPMPDMTITSIGYGLGSNDFGIPNFLRVFVGTQPDDTAWANDTILIIEVNLDDMNPQFCGHILERLYTAGALEAFISPIFMKKNRPAFMLTVMGNPQDKNLLLQVLFSETTTLGARFREEKRAVLNRNMKIIDTPYGAVRIKFALGDNGEILNAGPEYEDCRKLALEKGVPLKEIHQAALLAARAESNMQK